MVIRNDINLHPLPRILQARIADKFGGSQIEIPKHPRGKAFNRLAAVIGDLAAESVCNRVGPGRFYIPKLFAWQIDQRAEDCRTLFGFGLSVLDISKIYDVSVRSIEAWIKAKEQHK